MLRSLVEGLRTVTVLLWPFIPNSTERLLDALGAPELALSQASLGPGHVRRVQELAPLFPKDVEPAQA